MRFDELEAISKGTPGIYAGRKYIQRCGFRKEFEIDEQIIVILQTKMVKHEDGSETPMKSERTGQVIYDRKIYIPFTGKDGVQYLTQTKSPLIWRLVKNLPVLKTEEGEYGDTLEYREAIEGLLRFGEADYKYGSKIVPVVTLESAEE